MTFMQTGEGFMRMSAGADGGVRLVAGLAAVVLLAAPLWAASQIAVTVDEGERKTFKGFGVTFSTSTANGIKPWPQEVRDELGKLLWIDADFRLIRLWCGLEMVPGDLAEPVQWYIDEVREKYQPNLQVLLGPCNRSGGVAVAQYADFYMDFIRGLRDEYGLELDATGVCNEPNAGPNGSRFTAGQIPELVKRFRDGLDAMGMQNVAVVAPEVSNVDGGGLNYARTLRGDSEAWSKLSGFGTHSYGIAMTKDMMDAVGLDKDHWQTESSGGFQHGPAHVLSDLNLGITHWFFFFGYQSGSNCGGECLVNYNGGNPQFEPQYYTITEFAKHFRYGTRMRFCETDMDGEVNRYMECNRVKGPLPPICAAAGVGLDGKWVIGVSNQSGCGTTGQYGWPAYAATTFDVTIDVQELEGKGELEFDVRRRSMEGPDVLEETTLAMNSGRLVIRNFVPRTIAALRAVEATEEALEIQKNNHPTLSRFGAENLNGLVKVTFTVQEVSTVGIAVYDLKGRLLRSVTAGRLEAGEHAVAVDTRGIAAGVHTVACEADGRRHAQSLVIR